MRRRKFLKLGAAASAAGVFLPSVARAQAAWPDKPVKLIVPFAAGGGTDLVARPWADKLTQAFGQQFVVENRGGASGMIGTEAAVKSAADGYTFLVSSNTSTVNLPLLRKVPYDPNGLTPVARMGDVVTGFVIVPSLGIKTFQEMIDYAKKNPEKLAFGSSGPGTGPHLRMEYLVHKTGIKLLHVPYRGGADALTDLLAGNIHMMNEPSCNPHVKAGKIILLNVNHSARSEDFPDVPTLTELGITGADAAIWFSLWAPTGVPEPILDKLHAKIEEISKTDDMKAKLLAAGSAPVIQSRKDLLAFRESDAKSVAELIKAANIKIE
jgi:tripartite-type tricarboxylate transporter receptor subunit TctC